MDLASDPTVEAELVGAGDLEAGVVFLFPAGDVVGSTASISNLLGNVLRYGTIPESSGAITARVTDGVVTISDRGPGLPDEFLQKGNPALQV